MNNATAFGVRKQLVHTFVVHHFPDVEALTMASAPRAFDEIRIALDAVQKPRVKAIPSGQAHHVVGELAFDCGRGIFDQHVSREAIADNSVASMHPYVDYLYGKADMLQGDLGTVLTQRLKVLEQVFVIICANDLKGTDMAPKKGYDEQVAEMKGALGIGNGRVATQRRTIRAVVKGWNKMYPNNVQKVADLYLVAFKAMYLSAEPLVAEGTMTEDDARRLFMVDELIEAVDAVFAKDNPLASAEQIEAMKQAYVAEVNAAFDIMEKQWQRGVAHADQNAKYKPVHMLPQVEGAKARQVVVGFGWSDSMLFGAAMRYGNTKQIRRDKVAGQKHKVATVVGPRPFPQQRERPKADVVIQMYGNGKFVISGQNNMRLDRVAAALREADLRLQNVQITAEVKATLGSPGNFAFRNRKGEYVQALYFPNFRSGTGNNYQSNPFMQASALSEELIRNLVVAVLTTSHDVDTSDIVRDCMRG